MDNVKNVTPRTIFVIVDGLRDDAASRSFGFLEGLVDSGAGSRWSAEAVLPSVSRPAYESLLTGTIPARHGITSNEVVRRSQMISLWDIARQSGLSTAAVAYYFFSELYVRTPYDILRDRVTDNEDQTLISHGRFYHDEDMPDAEVLCEADGVRRRTDPHFLLIHLNHTDVVGHRYGGASREYTAYLHQLDAWLARFIPGWLQEGYTVVISADHGMSAAGQHGGTESDQRQVPIYIWGNELISPGRFAKPIRQEALTAFLCMSLGLAPAPSMDSSFLDGIVQASYTSSS